MNQPAPTSDPTSTPAGETLAALEQLRRQIDRLDEQIVELLSRRHAVVQQVLALKKAAGLPIYHPAREEDLISQRRAQARQVGLDPDHVEELYRCIVRQSRVRQTVHAARSGVRPGAKVLIVGGRGAMGQYFVHWFSQAGYQVRVLDKDDWLHAAELCAGIDLALVSVPIHCTTAVIQKLGPFLPADCVLADLTSIKQAPLEAMLAAHKGPVLGLHPLFGPSTSTMDQQVIVATPGRQPEACQWLVDQLTAWGNIVLSIDAQEHDAMMDVVQALRHFATFAFGRFLWQRQVNLPRTLEFSSPIYRLELGMVGRLFAQDPELYADIIMASTHRRLLVQEFVRSVAEAAQLVDQGDTQAFCQQFRQVAAWFGPFCEQAMRESSFLIDKLVERF
jgi:chorismate mutase/prephenate dehydrogenase